MSDEVELLPCDEPMERALIAGRQAWKACREADGYSDDHIVACIVRAAIAAWNTRAIEATRPTERAACPTCEGRGVYDSHPIPPDTGPAMEFECYACNGTGSAMKDAASD